MHIHTHFVPTYSIHTHFVHTYSFYFFPSRILFFIYAYPHILCTLSPPQPHPSQNQQATEKHTIKLLILSFPLLFIFWSVSLSLIRIHEHFGISRQKKRLRWGQVLHVLQRVLQCVLQCCSVCGQVEIPKSCFVETALFPRWACSLCVCVLQWVAGCCWRGSNIWVRKDSSIRLRVLQWVVVCCWQDSCRWVTNKYEFETSCRFDYVCCSVLLTRLVYTTHEHIWVPRTYMSPKRQASSFRLIVLQWFTVFGSRDSRTYTSSWLSSWLILTWWHVWPTWMCRDRGVVHVWHTNIYEFVTEFVTTGDLIEVRCTCDSQECVATEAGMVHVWLTWIRRKSRSCSLTCLTCEKQASSWLNSLGFSKCVRDWVRDE